MRVLIRSTYVTCVILRNRDCSMETKRKVTSGNVICVHVFQKEIYSYLYAAITKQKRQNGNTGLNAKSEFESWHGFIRHPSHGDDHMHFMF